MRPATSLLLLACVTRCTPEPPGTSRDGGLAFLPERHTDLVLTVTGGQADGGGAVVFQSPRAPQAEAGAEPPAAGALPLLSAEAVLADGSARALSRDGVTAVEPSARFRVEVAARLPEARLSLLDSQDAMVAADGTTETAAATHFALTPAAPLRPGSRYSLRLDGAEGRLLRAEDGRSFEPLSLAIRIAGDPPAPPRKAKRRRRR